MAGGGPGHGRVDMMGGRSRRRIDDTGNGGRGTGAKRRASGRTGRGGGRRSRRRRGSIQGRTDGIVVLAAGSLRGRALRLLLLLLLLVL